MDLTTTFIQLASYILVFGLCWGLGSWSSRTIIKTLNAAFRKATGVGNYSDPLLIERVAETTAARHGGSADEAEMAEICAAAIRAYLKRLEMRRLA